MKKLISIFLIFSTIFSLSACGNKKVEENIQVEITETNKEPFIYSHDIISFPKQEVMLFDPFEEDKLIDRYTNKIYYFSPTLGLYYTNSTGEEKHIMLSFETKNDVIFSTETRLLAISKNGRHIRPILTRDDQDIIKILFVTNDWIYYQVTTNTNEIKYFKINLSGTCKELKNNPENDKRIINRIYGDYFFPEILNYTENRQTRYRSRKNNFYITFPKSWYGNYTVEESKGTFIVYYKPRVDKSIQYEFFRIISAEKSTNLTPIENANKFLLLPSGTYKIGRYISEMNFSSDSFDGILINRMIKDIPEIIYSIKK